jgi:hypothetical protein
MVRTLRTVRCAIFFPNSQNGGPLIQNSPNSLDPSSDSQSGAVPSTAYACPNCGQRRLIQVSRHKIDRVLGLFVNLRRYRCRNVECRWEGNLMQSRKPNRMIKPPRKLKRLVNPLMMFFIATMLLIILFILIVLIVGWIDGSLEGSEEIDSYLHR